MTRLVLAASLVAACSVAVAAAAAPPRLDRIVLTPAQVGRGYRVRLSPGGADLKQPTLNLCGVANYPSEKLRTGRLQLEYAKRGSAFVLSNEVVTYRPGGAAQALREATQHVLACPRRPVSPGPGLPPLTLRFTRIEDRRLLPGSLAVRIRVTGTVGGKHVDQVSCAVYQRLGDVLSGVYSGGPPGRAQLVFCLHAAEQSVHNLADWYLGGPPA